MKKEISLILHNIRSAHNVGSIFRTADGAGVNKIYLTGYTPTPVDRFNRARKDIAKVALGAEKTVLWERHKNISVLVKKLKKEKIQIVALEQDKKSSNYKKFKPKFPLALIVGNEPKGLSKATLKKCDKIIEIPMRGRLARQSLGDGGKESLNVSVATAIALFSLLDK